MTGGGGFAGPHFLTLLGECVAPARSELDLLNPEAMRAFVRDLQPVAVFHLAAQASVARSWDYPGQTLRSNIEMTLNLLEAVRRECPTHRC